MRFTVNFAVNGDVFDSRDEVRASLENVITKRMAGHPQGHVLAINGDVVGSFSELTGDRDTEERIYDLLKEHIESLGLTVDHYDTDDTLQGLAAALADENKEWTP